MTKAEIYGSLEIVLRAFAEVGMTNRRTRKQQQRERFIVECASFVNGLEKNPVACKKD
jgi:hypothetical protein